MNPLIQFLNSVHELSSDLIDYLDFNLIKKKFNKKDLILKKGNICREIFFIEQGLIRCFYLHNDKHVTSWFMKEGDVIISVESFFMQKPSYENIEALEDCYTQSITFEQLQYAYNNFIEFNFIGRILTEKYYILSEQRSYSFKRLSAEERYHHLREDFPELVQRVSSTYLASYLGIRLETLSRIKQYKPGKKTT